MGGARFSHINQINTQTDATLDSNDTAQTTTARYGTNVGGGSHRSPHLKTVDVVHNAEERSEHISQADRDRVGADIASCLLRRGLPGTSDAAMA